MQEHKLKISHLDSIFLSRVAWANVGGLPGMILTLKAMGLQRCVFLGPPKLQNYLKAIRLFPGPLKRMDLAVQLHTEPEYKDETMTVYQIPLTGKPLAAESTLPQSPGASTQGGNSPKGDTGPGSPRAAQQSLEEGKKKGSPKKTGGEQKCASRHPDLVMAFLCKIHPKKGKFLAAKAQEMGLPVGTPAILPIITALKNGESITFEGREVRCICAFCCGFVMLPPSLGSQGDSLFVQNLLPTNRYWDMFWGLFFFFVLFFYTHS